MLWNPDKYRKFKAQRAEPFKDLAALLIVKPGLKVIDLGCGTGELTAELAVMLPGSDVTGIDSSGEMIDKARPLERPGLKFRLGKIEEVSGLWDLIFSNAALHWIEDHHAFIPCLLSMLNDGGQLLVQMPSNHRNRAQQAVAEIAAAEPHLSALSGWRWDFPALPIDTYAEILYQHGGSEMVIFDKVYPHVLDSAEDVMEWLSGTTIIPYLERLPERLNDDFRQDCLERLRELYPDGPFLFPFRRILFSAVKP